MPVDYDTVGEFYATLSRNLSEFVARVGEKQAFCGDRALQISRQEIDFQGCDPVICSKTALAAFNAIVSQGEGASEENADSHYRRFIAIREEMKALKAANPTFKPAHPAAVNPVLRRPVRTGARVWLENEDAAATVDLANTAYMLMLRLLSHSYLVPRPHPVKAACIDLALGLMRVMSPLAEQAARLPAGPSNPDCNAGMSFTALRDAAPLPPGPSAGKFFLERLQELGAGMRSLAVSLETPRVAQALKVLNEITQRAERRFIDSGRGCRSSGDWRSAAGAGSSARSSRPCRRRGHCRRQPGARRGVHRTRECRAHSAQRRWRRLHRGPRPHTHLRRTQVHPLALLRDLGSEGIHREREGAVDQS